MVVRDYTQAIRGCQHQVNHDGKKAFNSTITETQDADDLSFGVRPELIYHSVLGCHPHKICIAQEPHDKSSGSLWAKL